MKIKRQEIFYLEVIFWRYWFRFCISLKDNNLLGTGNEIDSSFAINEETALFKINYSFYSNFNPCLKIRLVFLTKRRSY